MKTKILLNGISRKNYDIVNLLRKKFSIYILCSNRFERLLCFFILGVKTVVGLKSIKSLENIYFLPTEINDYHFSKRLKSICFYEIPSIETIKLLNNKGLFQKLIESLNLPIPKTYSSNFINVRSKIIVKPVIGNGSRGIWISDHPHSKLNEINKEKYIFQKKLSNSINVEGFFAYCLNGRVINWYTHKRIQTWPKKGGVTVKSVSAKNKLLLNLSKKVIKKCKYSGFIMFEFIKDSDKYYFIECNPRLWGSIFLCKSLHNDSHDNFLSISLSNSKISRFKPLSLLWIFPYGLNNIFFLLKNFKNCVLVNFKSYNLMFVLFLYLYVKLKK